MADKQETVALIHPDRGRLTFDAEGSEGGRYHSRKLHVPGVSSGLTIGRGYDMGGKSAGQITTDLVAAGVDLAMAKMLSGAATLRGENARKFIRDNEVASFEISALGQKQLFDMTYAAEEKVAQRVCEKATKHGACRWDELPAAIRDLIVDLKYRGDYTESSREHIQALIVTKDLAGLAKAMADKSIWKSVPPDRFERRKVFLEQALKANPAN